MNENFSSKTTAATNTRWFCQKLPTYLKEDSQTTAASSSTRKRKKQAENSIEEKSAEISPVNRIIASPNITKTQIAKISYSSIIPKTCLETAKESFVQKRKERYEVIDAFQNMLKQLTIKHQETATQESAQTTNTTANLEFAKVVTSRGTLTAPNTYRRARTDLCMERPKSATIRTRSSFEIDTARINTSHTAPSVLLKSQERSAFCKKRSYDPSAARRFMKEQRKRRTNSTTNPGMENVLKKEEIKKRLEDLNKQSRAIVSKNVQKNMAKIDKINRGARLREMSPPSQRLPPPPQYISPKKKAPHEFGGQVPGSERCSTQSVKADIKSQKEVAASVRDTQLDNIDFASKKSTHQSTLELTNLDITTKSSKSVRTEHSEVSKPGTSEAISLLKTQQSAIGEVVSHRRVGLLRKLETKDHSFSHIKDFSFEKENVALEMLTPQLHESRRDASSGHSSKHSKTPRTSKRSKTIKSKHHIQHPAIKSTQVNNNPSLMGTDHVEICKKEAYIQTEEPKEIAELPYWLKPSSVQIYPYNFIQAVRRKLQAIAFPATPTLNIVETTIPNNEATSTANLNNLKLKEDESGGDFNRNLNNANLASEPVPPANPNMTIKSPASKMLSNEKLQKSQTISDFNSNLTSISLQAPCSNTVSEVSSIKSESVRSMPLKSLTKSISKISQLTHENGRNEETTVSSSIFNSPEKRQSAEVHHHHSSLSPLSLERIEKLKIKSKHTENNQNETDKSSNQQNLDFNKLLSDFNHGLSQVIEANEQLKSTLDKSQLILSPKESKVSQKNIEADTQTDYTNDFEELTHDSHESHVKVNSEQSSRRKLFATVTPMLTSPKTEQILDEANSELKLDLAAVTPSSIHSSELMANISITGAGSSIPQSNLIDELTPRTDFSISPHVHEERLATIVQLKENLRRMIKESKAQRKAVEAESNVTNSTIEKSSSKAASTTCSSSPSKRKQKKEKKLNFNKNIEIEKKRIPVTSTSKTISTESVNTSSQSGQHGTSMVTLTNTTFTLTELNESSEKPTTSKKANQLHTSNAAKNTFKTKSNNNSASNANTIIEELQQHTHETSIKQNNTNNNNRTHLHHSRLEEHENFMRTHINNSRGEYETESSEHSVAKALSSAQNSLPPPAYKNCRKIESPTSIRTVATTASLHTARSSEIVTLLKVADLDLSRMSSCDISLSESSLNYSNVGMYEQLIKSEITKSEQLASLLKMREKAILDRTKGQVAWLQVQKERCKSKGLLLHIATIRKKQRAILLKMAKEREEIKRILQSALSTSSNPSTTSSRLRGGESSPLRNQKETHTNHPPTLLPLTFPTARSSSVDPRRRRERDQRRGSSGRHSSAAPILRATHELETSASVEALLRQREEDLRRRRAYVERLIEWHRKLDEEEEDVYNLERQLFKYNNYNGYNSGQIETTSKAIEQLNVPNVADSTFTNTTDACIAASRRANEMERRLKEIDKSLRELNNISTTASTTNLELANGQHTTEVNADFVRTTGSKLNKLWRRLTSQHVEKFEPNRRYKLCKDDLEHLYEEAKLAVLNDFSSVQERSLLQDKSASTITGTEVNESSIGSANDLINAINADSTSVDGDRGDNNTIINYPPPVPSLNLNFSTGNSAEEHEIVEEIVKKPVQTLETFSLSKRYAQTTGDYSPSIAEKHFQSGTASPATSTSTTPNEDVITNASKAKARSELIKRNLQKFLRITAKAANKNESLQKNGIEHSLSDTEIDAKIATVTSCDYLVATVTSKATINNACVHFKSPSYDSQKSSTSTPKSAETLQSVTSLATTNSSSPTASIAEASNNIPTSSASSLEWRSTKINKHQNLAENEEISTSCTSSAAHSEKQEDQSDVKSLNYHQSINTEPQQITSEFDTKSNEIAAKLNEISEAVARLSQTNSLTSLPSLNGTQNSTNANQSQTAPEIENELLNNTNNTTTNSDFSYSTTFEFSQISNKTNNIATTPKIDLNLPKESPTLISFKSSATTPNSSASNDGDVNLQTTFDQSTLENRLLDGYELDFEVTETDETLLDNVSMPRLDTTFDTTGTTLNLEDIDAAELEKPTVIAEHVEQNDAAASTSNAISTITKPQTIPNTSAIILTTEIPTQKHQQQQQTIQQQLMPDIINELEIKRCQQILIENEQFRQYEHVTAVPYVYVREIPNKPPPPYCPPAHGSPMTTIFPSEDRIKDITFRRTHELYCELLKTDHVNEKGEKLPSVLDEKITNIYERIVLDICREYLDEHHEVLNPHGDPANFHSQLAFFNPPNRLRCIQESIYKDVRRCLGMDKTSPKRTPVYSIYGQRAKRDHIGQIIIQETYEEDEKWCSFYHEEDEVLDLIIEEMIVNEINEIAKNVFIEEGGVLEDIEKEDVTVDQANVLSSSREENEMEITPAQILLETTCSNDDSQSPES